MWLAEQASAGRAGGEWRQCMLSEDLPSCKVPSVSIRTSCRSGEQEVHTVLLSLDGCSLMFAG